MPIETELKLGLRPEDQRRVARLPLIRHHAQGRATRKRLLSIYYDTPDLDLQAERIALRVRRDGRQWVQTLKTAGSGNGGLHERAEYQAPVRSAEPDISQLPEDEGLKLPEKKRLLSEVHPVFETEVWRTTWELEFPDGARVELALDAGEIRNGNRNVTVSEIELELKRGLPSLLYEIALEIAESLDVRLDNVSKAARGYGLTTPGETGAVKAKAVKLDDGMTAEDALTAILGNCLSQVQANEPAVMQGEDPEGIHQMRVGFRRFRSCLSLYRKMIPKEARAGLRDEARPLLDWLSPARDWDVFLEEHLRPMSEALPPDPFVQVLLAASVERRNQHYQELQQMLGSREAHSIMLKLAAWVARKSWRQAMTPEELQRLQLPIPTVARKMLSRGHKRIIRRADGVRETDVGALHQLRIDVKKQRYATEFLSSLYARKAVRRYRNALRDLQNTLGHLNDAAAAEHLLSELGELRVPGDAHAYLQGWFDRGRANDLSRFASMWERFTERKRFWK